MLTHARSTVWLILVGMLLWLLAGASALAGENPDLPELPDLAPPWGADQAAVRALYTTEPMAARPEHLVFHANPPRLAGREVLAMYFFTDGHLDQVIYALPGTITEAGPQGQPSPDLVAAERSFFQVRELVSRKLGPPAGDTYWTDDPIGDPVKHWPEILRPGFYARSSTWQTPAATVRLSLGGMRERQDVRLELTPPAAGRPKP